MVAVVECWPGPGMTMQVSIKVIFIPAINLMIILLITALTNHPGIATKIFKK